jgi:hypothetical protein
MDKNIVTLISDSIKERMNTVINDNILIKDFYDTFPKMKNDGQYVADIILLTASTVCCDNQLEKDDPNFKTLFSDPVKRLLNSVLNENNCDDPELLIKDFYDIFTVLLDNKNVQKNIDALTYIVIFENQINKMESIVSGLKKTIYHNFKITIDQ